MRSGLRGSLAVSLGAHLVVLLLLTVWVVMSFLFSSVSRRTYISLMFLPRVTDRSSTVIGRLLRVARK